MKKIYFVALLLCCSLTSQAQKLKEIVDKIVTPSQVSTGILYNRVLPFANLSKKKDSISTEYFKQAYFELLNASYNAEKMPTLEYFDNWTRYKNDKNILPLGVIFYNFGYSEALSAEKVAKDNFTPPDAKNLVINTLQHLSVVPLSYKAIEIGKSFNLEFSKELYLTNTSLKINTIQADFGNGKISPKLSVGESFKISFTQSGKQVIRFTVYLSNGKEETALASIFVAENFSNQRVITNPPCFIRDGANAVQSSIGFTPYEYEPNANTPAKVEVGYYYASGKACDGQKPLTKPIILLDGFDPQDERPIDEIYTKNLGYNGVDAKFGIDLRDKGYDVIIVNFPRYYVGMRTGTFGLLFPDYRDGGTDYVERNAMATIAVIQTLNQELVASGSTEKLTIVGTSMGWAYLTLCTCLYGKASTNEPNTSNLES